MALGIKKITETVVDDNRSLVMLGSYTYDKQQNIDEIDFEEGKKFQEIKPEESDENTQNQDNDTPKTEPKIPNVFSLSKEALEERLSFSYEKEHLTKIPEKISVSVLKPRMLDDNDGAEEEIFNAKAKNQAVQESKKKRKQN